MWSKEDTVLFKIPDPEVVLGVENSLKAEEKIRPLDGWDLEVQHRITGLTGPLYVAEGSIISAEELSWFLRKGYAKSVLVGDIGTVPGSLWPTEQTGFLRPRVEYIITEFGKSCGRWY